MILTGVWIGVDNVEFIPETTNNILDGERVTSFRREQLDECHEREPREAKPQNTKLTGWGRTNER
jgi:hypothetical protein